MIVRMESGRAAGSLSPTSARHRLVVVTGSTRSGTSMAAGSLHHLGLHVPLPVLRPNDSNPRGFFESTWPLWFHRRILDKCLVNQTDGRPEAFRLVAEAVTDAERTELRDWLAGVFADARQVVVKDPRAIWVPWLWEEAAADVGASTGFLTMIRHPAEVVASRTTYYHRGRPDQDAWSYRVRNLCTWINANLGIERQTRDRNRALVRYEDLLADWRGEMRTIRDALDLELDPAMDGSGSHEVDAFIEPELRRHEPSWDGMDLPPALVGIAEGTWEALGAVADGRSNAATAAGLDDLTREYESVMRVAQAIAQDTATARARAAQSAGAQGAAADPSVDPASARTGPNAPTGRNRGVRGLRPIVRRWTPAPIRRIVRRALG